jgi:hypothetical protein
MVEITGDYPPIPLLPIRPRGSMHPYERGRVGVYPFRIPFLGFLGEEHHLLNHPKLLLGLVFVVIH